MKILFIAPYIPNRIRVRPYQWIRSLVQRGHELILLAVWVSPEEEADIKPLQEMGVRVVTQRLPRWRALANVAGALFSRLPLQAVYCLEPELLRTLDSVLAEEKPDVIHIEHLRGSLYGLRLYDGSGGVSGGGNGRQLVRGNLPLPIVWDSVDCISHLFQQAAQHSRSLQGRMMTRFDLPRTQRYEGWLVHQFDHVLVTSPADKAALINLAMQSNSHPHALDAAVLYRRLDEKLSIVANGVDLDYFTPSRIHSESMRIVFSGKMSYHANVTAVLHLVQKIMPLVWVQRPEAELWIVGKDPTSEVCALARESRSALKGQLYPQGRVVVTGSVPDIRPYLQQAAVAVAPIVYGAGIQNKVLEAMACGIPVVASKPATSALEVENGRELLIGDTDSDFAQSIIALLDDPSWRYELGQRGRRYVEHRHSWSYASARLEEIYEGAVAAHKVSL